MSSYYFTEEHEMFRESLRAFLQKEVAPNLDEWEEQRRIPRDIWKKMGDMGFLGLAYPEQYGGLELDFFYDVVFCEEVCKMFSGGFAITQNVVQYMSGPYILKYGSDRLKEKYLPGIISGEKISCIGITEPGAGSDVANIKTTAINQGEHYLVNGSKTFITNAVYGDFIITVVKTDPDAGPAGVSLLVIDRNAEGVSARKLKKLGWHSSDTAELSFDDVKVPKENLIGEEGQGFYYLMGGLQLERLVAAIMGYSGCESALEYALKYMSERKAFGRSINKFQVLRHRVAQMASEIEATKQFVLHCCRMNNDGKYAVKESSMAKLLATELSDKVSYQCLQFFGGYGYMEEYKAARFFRDSRIGTIGGGSSEIMREIIAKMVIDDVSYESAGQNEVATQSTEVKNGITTTGLNAIFDGIKSKAEQAKPLGKSLKFDFGDEQLHIDGNGEVNQVSTDNKDADCTVDISLDDFNALIRGKLNPMTAMMSGKLKVKGDMSVAMKLQTLFG
ncbi:MAG: acyl-CoA dehydrogenase [Maribacter sp.]|jgi:acyl-CoA dehydrogenase